MYQKLNSHSIFKTICNLVVIILIIEFSLGCKYDTNSLKLKPNRLDLNKIKAIQQENLLNYLDSVKYIKLQTDSRSYLGSRLRCLMFDSTFLIHDVKQTKLLFFNNKGFYKRQFFNIGKGPGEYLSITDIAFDEMNKYIVLMDQVNHKIINLDSQGNFCSEFIYPGFPSSFKVLHGNLYFFSPGASAKLTNYYSITVCNSKGKVINRIFKRDKQFVDHIEASRFSSFSAEKDSLIYWEDIYKDVNVIKDNTNYSYITPYYSKNGISTNELTSNKDFFSLWDKKNHIYKIINSKNYIFLNSVEYGKNINYIYIKKTNELKRSKDPLIDISNQFLPFWPETSGVNGCFYTFFDIINLKKNLAMKSLPFALVILTENSSIEDNPILILTFLK